MRRKFVTNLLLLLSLNFLVKSFWVFGIDVKVQNDVSAEIYGFYFAILNFSFGFQILLDMGITNFNNRNIAQNHQLINKHFSSIIILRFIFSIVYFAVIILIGYLIGFDSRQMNMLYVIGINQFLLSLILYLRSNISGLLLLRTDSILSVLDRFILILICLVLIYGNVLPGKITIEAFVYAQTAAYGLTAIIALIIVLIKAGFTRLNWNYPFFVMILKKSFPYASLVFLMGLYTRNDALFLERLLPDTGELQVGIFASAYRLLDMVNNQSGYLFAVLLLPIFAKLIKEKGNVGQMVRLSFTLLITGAAIIAIIGIFYSEEIMNLLYKQHSEESSIAFAERMVSTAKVFRIIMLTYVAFSVNYIFGTLLTANGSLKQLNIVALFGVVINFTLNIVLVPSWFAMGSAIACLSVQVFVAIMQVILSVRIFKLKLDIKYLVRLVIFIVFIIALSYYMKKVTVAWEFQAILIALISVLFGMVLRLLRFRSFVEIVRSKEQ